MKRVTLHIAGAFCKYKLILKTLLEYKIKNISINVFDGVYKSKWNGGRVQAYYGEQGDFFKKIDTYNKFGVGVYITFSNDVIENLKSELENRVLTYLNKSKLNGVIACNLELARYISANYKNIKLIYSVTGLSENTNVSNLLKPKGFFDLVCPRYEWVYNFINYENGPLSKLESKYFEIMLNDTCKMYCKFWQTHFKKIAELNRRYITLDNISKEEKDYILKVQECWISSEKENPNNGFLYNGKLIDTVLKRNDIQFLLSKGFSNFKISGRELPDNEFQEYLEEFLDCFAELTTEKIH